jgi:uncharacterized membrane protein YbhN (UPF0104 family)
MSSPARRRKRALVRAALASVVSVGVLVLVWHALGNAVEWDGIHLTPLPVLLAVAGALVFLAGRAWRFWLFLPRQRSEPVELLGVTAASWAAGLLLPGPSADVAFVGLARRRLGVSVAHASGVAIIARILDVVSLCVVAVLAALITFGRESAALVAAAALVGAAGAAVLVSLAAPRPRHAILRAAGRIPRARQFVPRTDAALDELATGRRWLGLVTATATCRVATALQYSALFTLVGLELGFWQAWFALSIRTLLFTIPIQGIAGIGTGQAWWAGALLLEGVAVGDAVAAGITLQAIDLAVSLPVAGLMSLALLRGRNRRRSTSAAPAVESAAG